MLALMAWRREELARLGIDPAHRGPRPAHSYRAARRNRVLREERGVWPKMPARYEPYETRRDRRAARRAFREIAKKAVAMVTRMFVPMRIFRLGLR